LIILLSFISVYHVVIAYIVIMHEHIFLYTHSLGRSWRPWIRTSRVLDILYCSGVRRARTFREELDFLLFWFWYAFLPCLPVISWFWIYTRFSLYSNSFIWYHTWMLKCDIAV